MGPQQMVTTPIVTNKQTNKQKKQGTCSSTQPTCKQQLPSQILSQGSVLLLDKNLGVAWEQAKGYNFLDTT